MSSAPRRKGIPYAVIRCPSVLLIAEPWDVGPGGYQVGNYAKSPTLA